MAEVEQTEFDSADAGASQTYPQAAGAIKKGGYAMLKGFPCKVMEISTSKTGKHGHAKASMTGLDIFTNKKYEDIFPTSHNCDVPFVTRIPYVCISVDEDNYCTLMDLSNNSMREDLSLPLDDSTTVIGGLSISDFIKTKSAAGVQVHVTVVKACGREKICEAKETP